MYYGTKTDSTGKGLMKKRKHNISAHTMKHLMPAEHWQTGHSTPLSTRRGVRGEADC